MDMQNCQVNDFVKNENECRYCSEMNRELKMETLGSLNNDDADGNENGKKSNRFD